MQRSTGTYASAQPASGASYGASSGATYTSPSVPSSGIFNYQPASRASYQPLPSYNAPTSHAGYAGPTLFVPAQQPRQVMMPPQKQDCCPTLCVIL